MSAAGIAGLALAALAAFVLMPLVIRFAHRHSALDWPGDGKLHPEPIPNLGGLGIVVAVLATLWGLELLGVGLSGGRTVALSVAALPVLFVGVADDLGRGSIPRKLAGHALAGGLLFLSGMKITELTNPFGDMVPLGRLALPFTLLWIVGIVNALNLVDGLNGLAAGIAGIAALSLSLVGAIQGEADVLALGLVLVGAIAGFYPYNFPRARVFLGDVGSTFLGLVLASLALLQNRKATAAMTLLLPIVALGLPVVDTLFAVVRRAASGRNPLHRDLGHLHHRLLRLGLSPRQAVAVLLAITALFGAAALLLAQLPKQAVLSATLLLGLATLGALAGLLRLERRSAAPRAAGLPQKA